MTSSRSSCLADSLGTDSSAGATRWRSQGCRRTQFPRTPRHPLEAGSVRTASRPRRSTSAATVVTPAAADSLECEDCSDAPSLASPSL
jgi:hypothetical protein